MSYKLSKNIDDDLDAELIQKWLPAKKADVYLAQLLKYPWHTEQLKLFGKWVIVPRKVLWFGDKDTEYFYSGKQHTPLPWREPLIELQKRLDFFAPFNSVLANYYQDGNDYMGWHSDDESELGEQAIIASLSLGASRRFIFRHKTSKHKIRLMLEHRSLLLMYGKCQDQWQHSLPKMKKIHDERINLTFRYIHS